MSVLASIKTLLEADATLLASATGGIFDWEETGRLGISRTSTPAAYDVNGLLLPCLLLRLRAAVPDWVLADDANQYVAVRETLEVWLYQDSGYATIEAMRDRCYALLHTKQVTNAFAIRWQGDWRSQHDMVINASLERSDYLVYTRKFV